MGWYLVGIFVLWCAYIFIDWQIKNRKSKKRVITPIPKRAKERTFAGATDVSGILPGKDVPSAGAATHSTIASATHDFDSPGDLAPPNGSSTDGSGSGWGNDSGGSDSGGYDGGGYDSGGYDSGGGYS